MVDLSVILPVHNEAENLEALWPRLSEVLRASGKPYEVIFVDDGSTDASPTILTQLAQRAGDAVKVIQLQRQFGQTAALAAGFDHATGGIIICLDADLQNDPSDIPALLQKLAEGYDVVSGWRIGRAGSWLSRQLPSRLANGLIRRLLSVPVHDVGCTLKAYRRPIVEQFKLYGEMHRFLPVLAMWVGARVTEIPVADHPRRHGRSHYGLARVFKVLLDLLTLKFLVSFGTRPSYVFGGMGLGLLAIGTALGTWIVARAVLWHGVWVSPLLFLMAIAVICGIQCLLMGILAEFVIRLYHESQHRPAYLVKSRMHLDGQHPAQNRAPARPSGQRLGPAEAPPRPSGQQAR